MPNDSEAPPNSRPEVVRTANQALWASVLEQLCAALLQGHVVAGFVVGDAVEPAAVQELRRQGVRLTLPVRKNASSISRRRVARAALQYLRASLCSSLRA
jgi:hypothetical protein